MSKFYNRWKTTLQACRGTFSDSDSKSLRKFGTNFLAAVGVIPPTGMACPFSDIPPSSFFFAFIHVHVRGLLRRRDKAAPASSDNELLTGRVVANGEKMSKYRQILGARGEELALQFLRHRGYRIIARNFSCLRLGEIDLIARHGNTTVFIEVKTRSCGNYGLPQEAIKTEKLKHLFRCAQFYIQHYANPEGEFRFAVVAIVLERKPKIELIEDIFS